MATRAHQHTYIMLFGAPKDVTPVSHAQLVGVSKYQEHAYCAMSLGPIATGKGEMAVKKLNQISILPIASTLRGRWSELRDEA